MKYLYIMYMYMYYIDGSFSPIHTYREIVFDNTPWLQYQIWFAPTETDALWRTISRHVLRHSKWPKKWIRCKTASSSSTAARRHICSRPNELMMNSSWLCFFHFLCGMFWLLYDFGLIPLFGCGRFGNFGDKQTSFWHWKYKICIRYVSLILHFDETDTHNVVE